MNKSQIYKHIPSQILKPFFHSKIIYKEFLHRKITDSISYKNGLNTITDLNLENHISSENLFILGSGSSINQLSDKHWSTIEKNDSFGFNYWHIHDFIPTFFGYEEPRNINGRADIFYDVLNLKKNLYCNTPIIIKDLSESTPSFDKIPSRIKPNIHLSYDLDIPIKGNDHLIDITIDILLSTERLKKSKNISFLYSYTASISYIIFFGFLCGYKNIILCGIDLNNTKYFYEEDKKYYLAKGIPVPCTGQTTKTHPTNIRTDTKVPATTVIKKINSLVLQPNGVKLFTGSTKSALYPSLPCFFK